MQIFNGIQWLSRHSRPYRALNGPSRHKRRKQCFTASVFAVPRNSLAPHSESLETRCLLTSTDVFRQVGADIVGAIGGDQLGQAIAISDDGNTVVISGQNSGQPGGHVRVLRFDGRQWAQIGADIANPGGDFFPGHSIAISSDGNSIALGAPYFTQSLGQSDIGRVRILSFDGSGWVQIGADITGVAQGDRSGLTIDMSAAGSIVAVGSPFAEDNGTILGHVRVFQLSGGAWLQVGQTIPGESAGDGSRQSVSLSGDGQTLAIGAPDNDANGINTGYTRVFRLASDTWALIGEAIEGNLGDEQAGSAVSLSTDGNTLALASRRDQTGASIGSVRVFQFDGLGWSQTGSSIDGEGYFVGAGQSVSLSDDGQVLAVSGFYEVHILRFDGSVWASIEPTVSEPSDGSANHPTVSISGDGQTVAIGGPADDSNGAGAGRVRVFRLDNSGMERPRVSLALSRQTIAEGDSNQITVTVTASEPVTGNRMVDLTLVGARISGADYSLSDDDPSAPGIQILIPDGSTSGAVSLTINDNSLDEADKTATLQISNPSPGIVIGTVPAQRLTITNDDNLPASVNQIGSTVFGEAALDLFGSRVALSADGSTFAAASVWNSDNGSHSGHVRVFRLAESGWQQIGSDIDGVGVGDQSGTAISLSQDGNVLAIGSPLNDANGVDAGQVRVFRYENADWVQIGASLNGDQPGDRAGSTVSLSADGQRLAFGIPLSNLGGTRSGQTRLLEFDGTDWQSLGSPIAGSESFAASGSAVSLSDDGSTVAIGQTNTTTDVRVFRFDGAAWNQLGSNIAAEAIRGTLAAQTLSLSFDGSVLAIGTERDNSVGTDAGQVRILQFDGSTWVQLGSAINGDDAFDSAGNSVSLSDDGRTVLIGSPYHLSPTGQARVFRFDGADWRRIGLDIDAEAQGEGVGTSVSLSGDGSLIAVGIPRASTFSEGFSPGGVRVYQILPFDEQTIELTTPDTYHIAVNSGVVAIRDSIGRVIASRMIGSEPVRIQGSSGDDRIHFDLASGTSTAGVLIIIDGGDGNDLIDARNSNDAVPLSGGIGQDTLLGSSGDDTLTGDDGDDSILGFAGNDLINGGLGNDTLRGGAHRDTLIGAAGNDMLRGNGSSGDVLSGGAGDDVLNGDAGSDQLVESGDTDFVLTDVALTGLGNDQILGIESARLSGGQSANRIDASGFSGPTVQVGYGGNDTLIGGPAADILRGSAGRDRLVGNAGNDLLYGQGTTGDSLDGGPGNDFLDGGNGNDLLIAAADSDFVLTGSLLTGDGRDIVRNIERAVLTGGGSANRIDASAFTGETTLSGLGGDDTIIGGSAHDVIRGAAGRDDLRGMAGDDWLFGQGSGGDVLDGGSGSDRLDDGAGGDRIISDGIDTIIEDALDTILTI